MLAVLIVVLPVFMVIGAGFVAVRTRVFPGEVIDGVTAFATRFAVPILLFSKMKELDIAGAFEAEMVIAFYAGALIAGGIGIVAAIAAGVDNAKAVVIGFAAYFSNTVLIGLPVMTRAYGEPATEPMLAIIAFHAPLLLTVGTIVLILATGPSGGAGGGALDALSRSVKSILRNGLMIGIVSGLCLNMSGLTLPEIVDAAVNMVASAALPTALFALGGALTRYTVRDEISWAVVGTGLSLFVHPGIAYLLGVYLFNLDEIFIRALVVTAAMPSGLNAYVFANSHKAGEGVAASTVVLSTAAAVLSVSFWLTVLGGAA